MYIKTHVHTKKDAYINVFMQMFGLDALWWRSHVGDGHVIAPEAQLFALLCPADCTLSHKRDFSL